MHKVACPAWVRSEIVRGMWGPPRMIALDIDGTILDTGRPISKRVLSVVGNAVSRGVHVVLATGRPVVSTMPVLAELGLMAGNVLCSNGAVRVDTASGRILAMHRFDPAPVAARLRELLPGVVFAAEQPGEENLVTGPFLDTDGAFPSRTVDHDTLVARPVTRLTAWWHDRTADELRARVDPAGFTGVSVTMDRVMPCLVAVPAGISKGFALERLRVELDVAADATLAVGDGDNDVEMLRWAEYGVAMGHAPDILKAVAREVTGSVADDGLAAILERWY
jgi:hydroxymethylpyrimidine pyrophosphatase-like HAD family hydrolase